ncbi:MULTISPECIES: hypothetical protein [unclassified Nocardiopsis]|uniref:hypothetical protein n=1 Tax=unclassified Nocardiopsis TaxID=2649073 RepID=UPI001161414C|nr:hypothetical protein [Nocardiopsis sp. TSRI0078]
MPEKIGQNMSMASHLIALTVVSILLWAMHLWQNRQRRRIDIGDPQVGDLESMRRRMDDYHESHLENARLEEFVTGRIGILRDAVERAQSSNGRNRGLHDVDYISAVINKSEELARRHKLQPPSAPEK